MPQKTSLQTFGLFLTLAAIVAAAPLLWSISPGGSANGGLEPGQKMPALQAAGWINGEAPEPGGLHGQVVVVNAWFLTCPYCHTGMPELVRLREKYREKGVIFVGLTHEPPEQLDAIREFLERYQVDWPNAYGAVPTLLDFKAEYFPGYWVVDRDGRVLWNKSMESGESLERAIERALAKPVTTGL